MTRTQKISLLALRLALGSMYLYAGVSKLMDPTWSAAGYLAGASTMPSFYHWLASPAVLPFTNFVNEWGLTLLGVSLLLGIAVRLSSLLGVALMLLYYLVILKFPYPNPHAYIVDEHVVYIAALLVLATFRAGRVAGLESWCAGLPVCRRYTQLRSLIG